MTAPPPPADARSGAADRCPGLLRPHHAADGAMVRLRAAGGRMTAPMFADLRNIAGEYGDGDLHLTSRANIQLRGLSTDRDGAVWPGMTAALRSAGFLPSVTHERVRNIIASPMSGIDPDRPDVGGAAARLDGLLCAEPALAGLSGRFLFGLDDGSGDMAALGCDLLAVAAGDGTARLWAGEQPGARVALDRVPHAMVALALRFVALADGRWRVRGLPERGRELVGAAAHPPAPDAGPDAGLRRSFTPPPVHYGALPGGALSVLAPLGVLTPAQSAAVLGTADDSGTVTVTPWRGLVITPRGRTPAGSAARRRADPPVGPDGGLEHLTAAGLIADGRSPFTRITACIGRPGCAKSAGDTHDYAHALAAHAPPDGRVHIVGCPRGCGAPKSDHRLIVLGSEK